MGCVFVGLLMKAVHPGESFTRNWLILGPSLSWVSKAPDVKAFEVQNIKRQD